MNVTHHSAVLKGQGLAVEDDWVAANSSAVLQLKIAECEEYESNLEQRLLVLQSRPEAFPDEVTAPQVLALRTQLVEMRRRTSAARMRLAVLRAAGL